MTVVKMLQLWSKYIATGICAACEQCSEGILDTDIRKIKSLPTVTLFYDFLLISFQIDENNIGD